MVGGGVRQDVLLHGVERLLGHLAQVLLQLRAQLLVLRQLGPHTVRLVGFLGRTHLAQLVELRCNLFAEHTRTCHVSTSAVHR
jgi:hypothetical protein